MMLNKLLLLLCLWGAGFAKEPPDIDCVVLHLEFVQCTWNRYGNVTVNYTFNSWFEGEEARACEMYLTNNSIKTGCIQPYGDITNRFTSFHMQLVHGNDTFLKTADLKSKDCKFPQCGTDKGYLNLNLKVKLNPPTNLTVQNGSDWNLWFYWNQTFAWCVQNEVRYKTNYKKWDTYTVNRGKLNYCINLPSSRSQYELQVRSRLHEACGASGWSDWSETVMWGSNTGPESDQGMVVWITVYVLAPVILILMVVLLLRYERFRIIFIRVVPKPYLNSIGEKSNQPWLQISKGFEEGFKPNYHEPACPVREYRQVSQ